MKIFFLFLTIPSFLLLSAGCGASKGDRYEKEKTIKTEEPSEAEIIEDLDITDYSTKIEVEERKKATRTAATDVWYNYTEDYTAADTAAVQDTVSGFRVQVIATDNLEEADNIRSEVYFKTNQMNVYLVFEPPFYIVKAGDFTSRSGANDLSFKLNQMGYPEARVIQDSVIVHK